MQKVIFGMGIPGSGKTTVLKKFQEKNNYEYICPDDIRLEMTGDTADQSKNREAWQEAYKRLGNLIRAGKTVVFDATLNNPRTRNELISFVKENGIEKIQGVFVDVPLEIAKERNVGRERVVPEFVLDNMHRNMENRPPDLSEGFDGIFVLDENQDLVELEVKREDKEIRKEFGIRNF